MEQLSLIDQVQSPPMTTQPIVSKDKLKTMLTHPNPAYVVKVIGRALIVLYNNQTSEEQRVNDTIEHNGVGFAGMDARTGSSCAKYYLRENNLKPWMVERWTKLDRNGYPCLCKYHKQLNEAATNKGAGL